MREHSLDQYLKDYCSEHPEYMNLYSTWNLNKTTCADALKNVVLHYPHFSMHDSSHADAVLSKIEMLLGDRISQLSPLDAWLILHAAYTHDLGMILKWEEIESVWAAPEFQDYLCTLESGADRELQEAAAWVRDVKDKGQKDIWPLKTYQYVALINEAFFRGQHAKLSRRYLDLFGSELKIDLGHSGLIKPRILKLLGRICELHTAPTEQIMTLDHQTDGFASDYAHPRFVAMLLRLGDLLDVDNGRFNTVSELAVGQLPDSSIPHKDKHGATTHLLVTPEEIQFTSDCPNPQAYLQARGFVDWLEAEVDFMTKHWVKIVPASFDGFAPRFDKKELYINGIPDIEGVAGLRFEISQEKAFQIIEGSNIYKDRFVFVREVLQNAMDASKLQLWRDLCSGTYQAWMDGVQLAGLQPYHIDAVLYKNYPIHVSLSTLPDGRTQMEVRDRGTGISIESFKRMCSVGTSNAGSEKLRQEIQGMPVWLRPTAGFGVGLQSIFLLADEFEIETSTGLESFHAVVHSNRRGGYLQLQRAERRPVRGTTIRMCFVPPSQMNYSMSGDTDRYLGIYFDPVLDVNHMCEARVLEAIKTHCKKSMFPIHVHCAEKSLSGLHLMDTIPVCASGNGSPECWESCGAYHYLLEPDCSGIKIWDEVNAAYCEIQLVPVPHSSTRMLFKGMEVDKHRYGVHRAYIRGTVDVYGFDTKQTISLDRSSLTESGSDQFYKLACSLYDFYIDQVLKRLQEGKTGELFSSENFDLYRFWCACTPEQQDKIPLNLLKQYVKGSAAVIQKNENGEFYNTTVLRNTLIPFNESTYFLNVDQFISLKDGRTVEYERILGILNGTENLEIGQIVVDAELVHNANFRWLQTVKIPMPDMRLMLYTVFATGQGGIAADGDTKKELLTGLERPIRCFDYAWNMSNQAKRYAIPALTEYRCISLGQPYRIAAPWRYKVYYVVSPFNREQAQMSREMSKEAFLEAVMGTADFARVVDFVLERTPADISRTRDEVVLGYKQLMSEYYDCVAPTQEEGN